MSGKSIHTAEPTSSAELPLREGYDDLYIVCRPLPGLGPRVFVDANHPAVHKRLAVVSIWHSASESRYMDAPNSSRSKTDRKFERYNGFEFSRLSMHIVRSFLDAAGLREATPDEAQQIFNVFCYN